MNLRTPFITALVLACLPVAAQAKVTLYGRAGASVEGGWAYSVTTKDSGSGTNTTNESQSVGAGLFAVGTRLGVTGSESLSTSTDIIWSTGFNFAYSKDKTVPTSSYITPRDTYIGLRHFLGSIKLGYVNTPLIEIEDGLSFGTFNQGDLSLQNSKHLNLAKRVVGVRLDTDLFEDIFGLKLKFSWTPNPIKDYRPIAIFEQLTTSEKGTASTASGGSSNQDAANAGADESYRKTLWFSTFGFGASWNTSSGFFLEYAGAVALNDHKANGSSSNYGHNATYELGHDHTINIGYDGSFRFGLAYGYAYSSAGGYATPNPHHTASTALRYQSGAVQPGIGYTIDFHSGKVVFHRILSGITFQLGGSTTLDLQGSWSYYPGGDRDHTGPELYNSTGARQDPKEHKIYQGVAFGTSLVHRF